MRLRSVRSTSSSTASARHGCSATRQEARGFLVCELADFEARVFA
jgi:hypothetical protein